MLEIVSGIFIGFGIETLCLSVFILYKRRKMKSPLLYDDLFSANINADVLESPPPEESTNTNVALEYQDL